MAINQQPLRLTDAQRDHLRAAAGHIERVRAGLDIEVTDPCGSCGRESAKNYTDFRLDQELGSIVTKLRRVAATPSRKA